MRSALLSTSVVICTAQYFCCVPHCSVLLLYSALPSTSDVFCTAQYFSCVLHCSVLLLCSALLSTSIQPRPRLPASQHFTRPSNSSRLRDEISSRHYDSDVAVAMVAADKRVSMRQTAQLQGQQIFLSQKQNFPSIRDTRTVT